MLPSIVLGLFLTTAATAAEPAPDPALSDADYRQGAQLMVAGKVADATPHFEAALKRLPDSSMAHNGLAAARFMSQRWPEAWTLVRKALALNPDNEAAQALANTLWRHADSAGFTQVGTPAQAVRDTFGQPDQVAQLTPAHRRWIYLWFAIDVVNGELYEALIGPAIVDRGMERWPDARQFRIGQDTFVAIYRVRGVANAMVEFVPLGQTIARHDRMVVLTRMPAAKARPLRQMMASNLAGIATNSVEPEHRLIHADDAEVVFHWWVGASATQPAQHEVTRFVRIGDEVIRIAYLHKRARMTPEELELWTKAVRSDAMTQLALPVRRQAAVTP